MSVIKDSTEIGLDLVNRFFCAKTSVNEKNEIIEKPQPAIAVAKRGLQLLTGGLICFLKRAIRGVSSQNVTDRDHHSREVNDDGKTISDSDG